MCYCCKCAANPLQGERIERKGDIPICDIPIYREIERPRIGRSETERSGYWESERFGDRKPRDRETKKPRDRETRKPGAEIRRWKESKQQGKHSERTQMSAFGIEGIG